MPINNSIINQKGTPAFFSDTFANRPTYGYTGRVFISTDTGAIYEDTGTSWTLIADAGAGTTGTLQQVTTNGSSTTVGLSTSGNGIGIGTTIPTSNKLDIHSASGINATFNGTGTTNAALQLQNAGTGKWNILNNYNAGANSFDIYNVGTSSNALSINSTSNVVTLNSYPLIDGGSVLIKLGSNTNANGYTGIGAVATGLTINLGAAGTTGSLLFNTSASYSYTFPAATGTLALTSNLSSYLPLAGGTLTGALSGTSITGTSLIKSGGTSAQILAADGSVITAGTNITISGGTIASSGGGGSITLSAIGSTPNANAATLTGSALNLEPASASFGGVVTTGTQTFAGAKTFSDIVTGASFIPTSSTVPSNGMYLSGANTLNFSTNSANRLNISSTGNIGIGNIPSAWSGVTAIELPNGISIGSYSLSAIPNLYLINNGYYNGSNWIYKLSSYPVTLINQSSGGIFEWNYAPSGIAGNTITFTALMRLFTTGNLVINSGTDDLSNKLQVTGNAKITGLAGTGSRAVVADASGVLSAPVSDILVKTNIKSIGYGLNEILKMNPVWFDYINEYKNYGKGRQNGNIAQEMEAIIPEAVFTTPSTGKMGINYDQLHAVYIKAIQELKAEINALKNN